MPTDPDTTAQSVAAARATVARPPMLRVVSVDDNGAPAFVRALSTPPQAGVVDDPAAAAWAHLRSMVKTYGWSASVIGETELLAVHDLPRVGFVARFGRRVDGVAVLPGQLKILMRRDGALVAAGGNLGPVVAPGKAHFSLNGVEALAEAISKESGVAVSAANLMSLGEQGDFQRFQLQGGLPLHIPEAARVKPVWFATEGRLAPAFFTEFYVSSPTQVESYAVRIIVDADTGATLDRRSLTQFEAFNYRVWADGDGRPLDGPITDLTPHPTGLPDGSLPTLVPSGLVLMEGFNVNPDGEADPWLAASASQTLGNNVDAYADHAAPDGYSNGDTRATTNGARTFDWTMDFNAAPESNEASIKASVTQLFYNVNWLHDDWYFSGFDEAAGNAQASNFERGGLGGDVLRAEAQDNVFGGSRNNANMSTPSDGLSPRMQMYSWTGATTRSLVVSSAPAPLSTNTASFGPTSFNLSAQVVEGLDGVGTAQDGCEPLVNNVAGALVVISRGACTFVQKATNVQAAGGIGMILANNAAGAAPPGLGGTSTTITIGVLSITLEDGDALRTAIQAGQVTGTMSRTTAPDRDGSLDNLVVAHEWGHYLHHRLTDCGSLQCAGLSEGWGDFLSLHTSLRDGDDIAGVYSQALWASLSDPQAAYFGIRRVPYSTDATKDPLTFTHIQDGEALPAGAPIQPFGNNAEVHNTGEVWATMMLQAYGALILQVQSTGGDFATARRAMADYVVAGLMLLPTDSTFTESRDGILAAAYAANPVHAQVMAQAFAMRGIGSCAKSPDRYDGGNIGVVEGYTLSPLAQLGTFTVSDDVRSCDGDGVLDGDEQGILRIPVQNFGPTELANAQIVVTSTSAGVANPGSTTYAVPTVPPYGQVEVEVPVALDAALNGAQTLTVGVRLTAPGACVEVQTSTVVGRSNVDDVLGAQTDDAEATRTAWTAVGTDADVIWGRTEAAPLSFRYYGADYSAASDTAFVSPTLQVSATGSFVVSLMHRYSFEADAPDGSGTNWDGAVVEISGDDGATWSDVSDHGINPGYRGTLTNISGNPLADSPALVGTSTAWPALQALHMDFGTAFAGQQVRLRFRIGTDAAANDYGWDIDDISVTGIDNAPFYQVVTDVGVCPPAVVADAGPDQAVGPAAAVLLDARASSSIDSLPLTYAWIQISGPSVTLASANTALATFTAPSLETPSTLVLQVTVSDGTNSASDQVTVTVSPIPVPTLTANAGADQTVDVGDTVVLDGSGSQSSAPVALTYAWTQVSGTQASLQGTDRQVAVFSAPEVTADETLEFELTVSDGVRSTSDRVRVTVRAAETPDPVVADAGEDVTVSAGSAVILDGSASTGPDGLSFAWAQVGGPTITAQGTGSILAFTAPIAATQSVLTFELTVSAGGQTSTDTVVVTVNAQLPTNNNNNSTGGDDDGGCGCTSTGSTDAPGAAWAGLALLGLLFVRRRR